MTFIFITKPIKTTNTTTNLSHKLPTAINTQTPNLIQQTLIKIKNNNTINIQTELIKTLWEESLKLCDTILCYNAKGNSPVGSVDRGPCMYNDYWRKDIPDSIAFSMDCIDEMVKDFRKGKQRQWYGYRKWKLNN